MNVTLSPDGMRVAVSVLDPTRNTRDIEIYELARDGLRTRFTFDPADEFLAIWAPDGSRLAFSSSRKGRLDIYQKASSGVGSEDLLLADGMNNTYPWGWSPNGRFIVFSNGNSNSPTGNDVWVLPVGGDHKPVSVVQTPFNEAQSQFSPDGRWIAYQSNESGGSNEVFVVPFSAAGSGPAPTATSTTAGKWQVSRAGGSTPRWRHDGKELFYMSADNRLMAAAVNGQGAAFQVGAVTPLFEVHRRLTGYRGYGQGYNYDVSADGQRFLVNTVMEQPPPTPITIVINWTAGLRK
jgi:Tol biopolymer transport system component